MASVRSRDLARAVLVGLEFHQACRDDLGQVALLVPLGHLDRFVDLAFAQRAGDCRSECPRLVASRVEGHPTVNHHANRPARHDEKNDDHGLRQNAHLLPERNRVPTYRGLLQEPGGE
jgi:hypothetical protein